MYNSDSERNCLPSPRSIWAAVIWTIVKHFVLILAIVIILRASSGSCSLKKLGKLFVTQLKLYSYNFLWKMKKKWIESQDLLFYLPVLNRSFSKAVTNFWKLLVPNCLRLPLEDSKIDNKLSIRQVSFAIIRGNLLLAKKMHLYNKWKSTCT